MSKATRYFLGGLLIGGFWYLNRHRPPWEEALRTIVVPNSGAAAGTSTSPGRSGGGLPAWPRPPPARPGGRAPVGTAETADRPIQR